MQIRLLGQMASRPELARLLVSADVFVHPNAREPFGIGPSEAMASGIPLVVPDTGGVMEYADTSCAWLAKPQADAFATAVLDVLSNRMRGQVKVQKARSVAERHDWRVVTSQCFDFHASRGLCRERSADR